MHQSGENIEASSLQGVNIGAGAPQMREYWTWCKTEERILDLVQQIGENIGAGVAK